MLRRRRVFYFAVAHFSLSWALPAYAQDSQNAVQEQARIKAERDAAERVLRDAAPVMRLDQPVAPQPGTFPEDSPCYNIQNIVVEGATDKRLGWVLAFLDQYRGKCAGAAGLDHLLRSLQGIFLDRGLITTRAGLPEQDLSSGTLRVVVIPGIARAVRTNKSDKRRTWEAASPVDTGDLITLRALEQGLEQLRRIPGRDVKADLTPGDRPGDTIIDVSMTQKHLLSGSLSVNNFAGTTVGRWQGSGQIVALGLLGFSELVSASYNQRVDAPGIPANSKGRGISISVPFGWWTFGASGSSNRYGQTVMGEVGDFATRGKLDALSAYVERTIHRDRTSKTALRFAVSRRWARNFINDIEIGIQRQDLSDIEIGLNDRRSFGAARLDSSASLRMGTGLFGAQKEPVDRPSVLPSARYRIFSVDVGLLVPLGAGFLESWRADFHGQMSGKNLYGSDTLSIGGPYTVRGLDSETAELGRSGWFLRQELGAKITDRFKPYALFDMGQVKTGSGLRGGVGIGLRSARAGFSLDAFAALPVFGKQINDKHRVRFGLSAGWGF